MTMDTILAYLSALEQNNNREWYHENKQWLNEANQSFEHLIHSLVLSLRETDSSIPMLTPKELTFKLVRDTRFSRDKSPYNPVFRAHISSKGKLPIPVGYYIMIQPGNRSFLGGGLFADVFKEATTMVRDHIAAHGDDWQRIISEPDFKKHFTIGGSSLKNVPKGYDPDHLQGEYLKNKSWYLEFPVSDKELLSVGFLHDAVNIYKRMQPFHGFLNNALADFQMPTR